MILFEFSNIYRLFDNLSQLLKQEDLRDKRPIKIYQQQHAWIKTGAKSVKIDSNVGLNRKTFILLFSSMNTGYSYEYFSIEINCESSQNKFERRLFNQ